MPPDNSEAQPEIKTAIDAAREAFAEQKSATEAAVNEQSDTVAQPSEGRETTAKASGRDEKGRFATTAQKALKDEQSAAKAPQQGALEPEATPAETQQADPLADVPTHIPPEWRELIKQNPAAKGLVLKQFSEGNKIINKKTFELTKAHQQVESYLKVLTTGLDHVVQDKYKGDRNIFAADVNRLVQNLNHPQAWKRYEALQEIAKMALPDGYDAQQAPNANERAIFEQLEELKRLRQEPPRAAPVQEQPQQPSGPEHTQSIQRELDNISRYNAEARNFIGDPANATLIIDKYRQKLATNPDPSEMGVNVMNAVFEAMQEKAKSSAAAAARETQEAKRQTAAQLSMPGTRNSREPPPPKIENGTDAARAAMAELRQRERV